MGAGAGQVPLQSFFMAGFECSSHRRQRDGVRLDLIAATGHDRLVRSDYQACFDHGLRTIRDGLRWHLIEQAPGRYDWSSWMPMLEAAAETGVQVMWDLFHYGSPDHVDLGSSDFVDAYAAFAAEAVRVHRAATGLPAIVCPINEISFFTWAVGTGYFEPAGPPQPGWLKRQLVRAAVAGVKAMRAVDPACRFIWAEPLIHVTTRSTEQADIEEAEQKRLSQFGAYDLLTGQLEPELGGGPDMADFIGLNFYSDNQWYFPASTIPLGHHDYRPLADMLEEAFLRYRRPLLITETMAVGSARPAWLHYICEEVREAIGRGVPVSGICLYPIASFPGWDDEREIGFGLLSGPKEDGERRTYQPLAEELRRQQALPFGA